MFYIIQPLAEIPLHSEKYAEQLPSVSGEEDDPEPHEL
jgi:hypothetical protein